MESSLPAFLMNDQTFEVLFMLRIKLRKPLPKHLKVSFIYSSQFSVGFKIQVVELTIPASDGIGRMLKMERNLVKSFFMYQVLRCFN